MQQSKKHSYLNQKRIWSDKDKEFLLESYGIKSMSYLIRHLKRSKEAIHQKYKELMGFQDMNLAGGLLSPPQVAEALGVNHRTVIQWICHFGLKAKQLHKVTKSDKRYRYFIDPYDLWKWIELHKERVNFAHIKRGIILPEPKWLDEEITKAKQVKRPTNWTQEEDEAAWFWWQSGMNYREIARRLGRPEKGTQRRLTVIRKRKGETHRKTN